MTGVIGGSIVAFGVIAALALVDCPVAVVTGAAFGMLGLSLAWTRLWWVRERRRLRNPPGGALGGMSPWEEFDRAILEGDLSLGAWRVAGQVREGGRR